MRVKQKEHNLSNENCLTKINMGRKGGKSRCDLNTDMLILKQLIKFCFFFIDIFKNLDDLSSLC